MTHLKENRLSPGEGLISLQPSTSQSWFTTLQAAYPLKFLSPTPLPSQPANVSVLYTLAYGGGLVAGDTVGVRGEIGESCGLIMLTQGSTKVYKRRPNLCRPLSHSSINIGDAENSSYFNPNLTRQRMHLRLAPHAFLLVLPDSISPFASSVYSQAQRFILPEDGTASILILDWVNSGRGQRHKDMKEEIWSMDRYASNNEVYVGKRLVMRERIVLDNKNTLKDDHGEGGLSKIASQLSPYNVYATALFLGSRFAAFSSHLAQLSHQTRQYQLKEPPRLVWSFSEVDQSTGAGVVRVAATEVEEARRWLRGAMTAGGVAALVGEGLWSRCI
ncbi:uncharacterized protein L203_100165 [Cryptococcus depauperatus CBS 7841]|uniref:Uncharacterized protein n=1 Tax=Cryptococcus depauperatus CBS 7841 TaxID=1295531 RepID=A0A1E3J019_9TREE|nr:urease accessory protein [Cryptococcus depauperatus CBS 7841]